MSSMTGLNGIVRFCWLVWTSSFSHCLSCYWRLGLLGLLSSRVGILTGWQVPIWRAQTSLTAAVSTPADSMGHSLLLLWGPELKGISSGGVNLEDSEFCGAPRGFRSNRFHASPV